VGRISWEHSCDVACNSRLVAASQFCHLQEVALAFCFATFQWDLATHENIEKENGNDATTVVICDL